MIIPVVVCVIFLTPFITYLVTFLRYKSALKNASSDPPCVPHTLPFIGHTLTFMSGDKPFADSLMKTAIPEVAVRFNGLGFSFILLSGSSLVRRTLISASHHLDWNIFSAPLFQKLFGGTDELIKAIQADDSGIGAKPYPGSTVAPGRRLLRNQILFYNDAFSKASSDELYRRFGEGLESRCNETKDIGYDWIEKPDLYYFLREIMFQANIDAFFGPSMRSLNPEMDKYFGQYEDHAGFLASPKPRWLRPEAERARDRCLAVLMGWRCNAERESENLRVDEDAVWDSTWGSYAIRRRNKLLDGTDGLFDDVRNRASLDLAFVFALTSNVIPATFWYLFSVLATPNLLSRTRHEISKEMPQSSVFLASRATKLTSSSLLQAIYAETLRLNVITLITRTVKKETKVGPYLLRKGQNIMVSTHIEHLNPQWDVTTDDQLHRSTEFYPDRFLTIPERNPKSKPPIPMAYIPEIEQEHLRDEYEAVFSLDGRQGQFLPFGIGEHMCPGRHFAKHQMIVTFAALVSRFDIELLTPEGWKPESDLSRYGFGTQGPKQKVEFRIRRRTVGGED